MINEHPLLASYSNIFVIVSYSFCIMTNIDVLSVKGTTKVDSSIGLGNHILMEGLYKAHWYDNCQDNKGPDS